MKKIIKIGLGIICIMIALVGVPGCKRNDNTSTSLTGIEESNLPPTQFVNEINGSANITKGGFAAIQDGWIYYAYASVGGDKKDGLYKMKIDGTNKVKICGGTIDGINVIGDWIYYSNYYKGIYRIKTNGTGKKKIRIGYDFKEVNVVGNEVYFIEYSVDLAEVAGFWGLCKMNVFGNKIQLLHDEFTIEPNMYIVNGWIYFYMNENDKWRNIYKMRTDGTDKQLALENKTCDFVVAGDWIYYLVKINKSVKGYNLYKVKTDGSGRQKIAEEIDISVDGLNVAGDWIYYLIATNEDDDIYNLYKIKTDGSEYKKVAEEISVDGGRINVAGDWIFYQTYESDRLYRIKTDGTNKEIIESGKDVKE